MRAKNTKTAGQRRGAVRVSLRKKSRRKSVSMAVRVPEDLYEYVKRTAVSPGAKGEVVRDAIELDRDLAVKMGPDDSDMEAFARSQGLNMADDLAEVMARLMRLGLGVYKAKGSSDPAGAMAKLIRLLEQAPAP